MASLREAVGLGGIEVETTLSLMTGEALQAQREKTAANRIK
jgi:hypothetical protein